MKGNLVNYKNKRGGESYVKIISKNGGEGSKIY